MPTVALGADLCDDAITVFTDPRSVAQLAVEHFLGLGQRHFAYVGYRPADGSRDRRRALADELATHGLRLRSYETETRLYEVLQEGDGLDNVEPGVIRLIQRAKKPLAVVVINDRFAAAVCRLARCLELAVPDDVAVLGVGDHAVARVSSPPISSIRLANERMGYEAAHLLHRLMRGERVSRRAVQLPTLELVERESTVGKQCAATTDVERALAFIEQNACDAIRVEDVAAHVRLPLRTFELQFAATAGRTVGEAIRSTRLNRAKTLLETTDLPLDAIARQLGMNAGSYLNEFFRRWTGTTPGKYRQKHCGGKPLHTGRR